MAKRVFPMLSRLASYAPVARIGRGGVADVYAALDPLGDVCALKVQHTKSSSGRRALEREFQIQSWVEHPALVRAFDAGVLPDGRGWLAMEVVDGVSARRWVGNDRVSGRERAWRTVQIIAQVARGLEALHKRGLVHGDVKPSNLMVQPDGTLRLMDLGMARWISDEWFPEGHFAGTTRYASPEQLSAGALTPASDVFSLAATAYALIRGRSPFGAKRERPEPPPMPAPLQGMNALLSELLLDALESDPTLRPTAQTLAQLAEAQEEPEDLQAPDDDGAPTSEVGNTPDDGASTAHQPTTTVPQVGNDLLPSEEQLLALLAIAGEPVETQVVASATKAAPQTVRPLLEGLTDRALVERSNASWWVDSEPPARAPWNEALAEGLLQALDPWPSLGRAHALQHLGRLDDAAQEALRVGRGSQRLAAIEGNVALSELLAVQTASADRSLLDEDTSGSAAASPGNTPLTQGLRAAAHGDGVEAMRLAGAALTAGADPARAALLRSRGLLLQGRATAATLALEEALASRPERVTRCLALIELASTQHHIGRTQLARDLLQRARLTLPAHPSDALLARWIRVSAELDVALGRPLDAAMLREVRTALPPGDDARILAAVEVLARRDEPDSPARRDAIAAATAPGDDVPAMVVAIALSIVITGRLPDLPDAVAEWLAQPGSERWQLMLLFSAMNDEPSPLLLKQTRETALRMLPRWGPEDAHVFRLHPRWQRWL